MLTELHISNIAVIEKADVAFHPGLTVLTGETGAGKSIIIDSILAILGARVSKDLVRTGTAAGAVSACFDAADMEDWFRENDVESEDGEIVIQRKILADGKSSGRVNGIPVSASQLKGLGAQLIDVHGQNDGRLLLDERRHILYLDSFGSYEDLLEDYALAYQKYRSLQKEMDHLRMDDVEKERLRDSLSYRIAEVESVQLQNGEYDELVARRDLLRNSEKLTEALREAMMLLSESEESALAQTQNAVYYVSRAAAYSSELESTSTELNEAAFAISNAVETIRDFLEDLDFSPEEYDRIEHRISVIGKLMKKYAADEAELLEKLEQWKLKLSEIDDSESRMLRLNKEIRKAEDCCRNLAEQISCLRKKTAKELQVMIERELRELNMPSTRFVVDIDSEDNSLQPNGIDNVQFLMSANAGENPGRISKIASGGELSRIMLAMKNVFARNDSIETMIFDEIDTGVSGIAAQRVAEKLYSVSVGRQVMCVTHLPQIAAMADHHYRIQKQEKDGRTYTEITELDAMGRQEEIARLYGGDRISMLTLADAQEQIKAAEEYKKTSSRRA